ncbi:hypothetical protein CSAL01_05714 [Colletotrichum salicis]|uniref:Uncharacterized protein n=1 Tax=Colletotrichum salicis TaxID=1209931 RepID=A0A135UL21_9PEZI|nr:hypothetical protein CSAL01_05714 [Colletotrichum salicis]
MLRLAQPANAHGTDTDIIPAREPKQHGENHHARRRRTRGQPNRQARNHGQHNSGHITIKRPSPISPPPGQRPTEDAAGIKNRQDGKRKGLAEPFAERVTRDIRQRDKQRKLHEEDARRRETKRRAAKDARVRVRARVARRREARAYQKIGGAAEGEADEADGADGPAPADDGEEGLHHEREDDAADGAAGGGHACGEAAAALEPVAYGCDGGGEDEGAAEAAEDAEGDHEVPVYWEGRISARLYVFGRLSGMWFKGGLSGREK